VEKSAGLGSGTCGKWGSMDVVSGSAAPEQSATRDTRTVALRIPAKAEYITLCRLALSGLAQVRAISDETVAELKLALTEAVSNSVRHAYGPEGDGHVDVTFDLMRDRVSIEVVDDGEGFDPDEPPSFDGDELSEGGLGIAIIRSVADDFEIESAPGRRGSRLRFAKRL
jgi:serine/threonine-protein kinase RsbW